MRSTTKRNLFVAIVGTFILAVIFFRYGGGRPGRPRVMTGAADRKHQRTRHLANKRPTGNFDGKQVRLNGIAGERGAVAWVGGREEVAIVPRRRSKGRDWWSDEKKKMAFQKYPAAKAAPVGHELARSQTGSSSDEQPTLNITRGKTGGKPPLVQSFNKLKSFSAKQTGLFKRVDGEKLRENSAGVGKSNAGNAVDDETSKKNIIPIRDGIGLRPTKSSFGVNKRLTTAAYAQTGRDGTNRSRWTEKETDNAAIQQQNNVKGKPTSPRVGHTRGIGTSVDALQSHNMGPYTDKKQPTANLRIGTHSTGNAIVRYQFKSEKPNAKQQSANQKVAVASTERNGRTRDADKAKMGFLSHGKTPDVKQPFANQDRSRWTEKETDNAAIQQQKNVKGKPTSPRVGQTRGIGTAVDALQSHNVGLYTDKKQPTANLRIGTHSTGNAIVRSQFTSEKPNAKQQSANQKVAVASTERNGRTRDKDKAKMGFLSHGKTPDVKQPFANQNFGVSSTEKNARNLDANKAEVGFQPQRESSDAKQTSVNQRIGNAVTNRKTRIRGTDQTAGGSQSQTDTSDGEQPLVNRQIGKERASLTYDATKETHGFQSPRKYPDGKQLVAKKQIVATTTDRNPQIRSTEKATDRSLSLNKTPDNVREVVRERKPKWPILHN